MDIMEMIEKAGGISAISQQLGISPQEAQSGAGALLPSILHGFGQKTAADQATGADTAGGGGLADILSQLGGGGLADNVVAPEPTEVDKGNEILGNIFGSKEVSRDVASQASQSSGLNSGTLKKMLPILAMLVGGMLSSRAGGGGGLGSILGSVLGGSTGNAMGGGGGLSGMLGSVLGSYLGGRA